MPMEGLHSACQHSSDMADVGVWGHLRLCQVVNDTHLLADIQGSGDYTSETHVTVCAQVNARILPPPQLIYNKQQQPLAVGTSGSWNMVSSTFCEPSGFDSFGIVSFCNERFCGGGQQNPDSLEVRCRQLSAWLLASTTRAMLSCCSQHRKVL